MPRRCSICDHARRTEIDKALVGGDSMRTIAHRFACSEDALKRHKREHLPVLLMRANQANERARLAALQTQADGQEAAQDTQALDVMAELRRLFETGQKLRRACDEWLTDPEDPSRFTLEPRSGEVNVVYVELDDDGKRRRRKAPLETLLARLNADAGLQAIGWESRHADPRELLLKAIGTLTEQLEIVHKLVEAAGLEDRIAALEALTVDEKGTRRAAW